MMRFISILYSIDIFFSPSVAYGDSSLVRGSLYGASPPERNPYELHHFYALW